MEGKPVGPVTRAVAQQRTFTVVAADAEEARQAAKDEARRAGLHIVTVASVRRVHDTAEPTWVVVLAVRA